MGSVTAELTFIANDAHYEQEKPYDIIFADPSDPQKSNCRFESVSDIRITDCRPHIHTFSLQKNGFQFMRRRSELPVEVLSLNNDESRKLVEIYLKETISIVKEELHPEFVICFDWRIRKRGTTNTKSPREVATLAENRHDPINIAQVIHLDSSYEGGKGKLRRHLSDDELQKYTKNEWDVQILNVWRPISEIVKDAPLTLCDPRTVLREDLLEVDKVHVDHVEEGCYVKHRTQHEWFYLSNQSRDEITLFRAWSMKDQTQCTSPPHGAFLNSDIGCHEPLRQSMEVRLIVVTRSAARNDAELIT